MGPRRLDDKADWDSETVELRVTDIGPNRIAVAKVLHVETACSLEQVQQCLKDNGVSLKSYGFRLQKVQQQLTELGATAEIIVPKSNLYPRCPCAMAWVEEVDGVFYDIIEHRSPDGVTHEAVEIGPRGGPYKERA